MSGLERCEMQLDGSQAGLVSCAKDFGLDARSSGKPWKVFKWRMARHWDSVLDTMKFGALICNLGALPGEGIS